MLAEKYRCEAVDCYVQNALFATRITRSVSGGQSRKAKRWKRIPGGFQNFGHSWLIIYYELEFTQQQENCYSRRKAEIGFQPKRRVLSLQKSWAFCQKLQRSYLLNHNGKNILGKLLTQV